MGIESKIYSFINNHRISPFDFEVGKNVDNNIPFVHPESNSNPLGDNVCDLSLFVVSDTHYHVPDRTSYDRTKTLPTTKIINKLRRRDSSWHQSKRPQLYNQALSAWRSKIDNFLDIGPVTSTNNALIIHAGDMADDSLNKNELHEAIAQNQFMLSSLEDSISDRWGENLNSSQIYLMGDHDVDYRGWNAENRMKQIVWMYEQFGLFHKPASFLQEVHSESGCEGVLMLDTNLLNDDWNAEILRNAHDAVGQINQKFGTNVDLDEILANSDAFQKFSNSFIEVESADLLKIIRLYRSVTSNRIIQQELIRRAQEMKDPLIIGHHPRVSIQVAKTMNGSPTVISGHMHFPLDNDTSIGTFLRPKTNSGQKIRYLQTGAATIGLVGVEFPGTPTGYFVQISEDRTTIHNLR